MASPLDVLRDYALRKRPELLPPDVRLIFTENTLAVFDKYPKSKYHFVLLPRIKEHRDASKYRTLQKLLSVKKEALEALLVLQEEAKPVIAMIEDEMVCPSVHLHNIASTPIGRKGPTASPGKSGLVSTPFRL